MMKNGEDAGWRLKRMRKKIMLTETFDKDTEQNDQPGSCLRVREKVCDISIVTFSDVVVEEIRKKFRLYHGG